MNDEGKLVGDDMRGSSGESSSKKFNSTQRTYRVLLDPNQYKLDTERVASHDLKEEIYNTFNLFVRRRPKENNFKAILESIRDLMNTKFVVPATDAMAAGDFTAFGRGVVLAYTPLSATLDAAGGFMLDMGNDTAPESGLSAAPLASRTTSP